MKKQYEVYMELLGEPMETVTWRVWADNAFDAARRARIMAQNGLRYRDPLVRKTTEVKT